MGRPLCKYEVLLPQLKSKALLQEMIPGKKNQLETVINTCVSVVIASPVCSIKPLSKDITPIFKLFYEKVERLVKSLVRS